tara:strand:- start:19053 stop:19334 length:282 start_codon:yes stop_codon:yes gene_type:complete
MIQAMIAKKIIGAVFKKIETKHKLNKLKKYVEQDNELDIQMKQAQKTMAKQGRYIEEMEKDIAILKKDSHPRADWICMKCGCNAKKVTNKRRK